MNKRSKIFYSYISIFIVAISFSFFPYLSVYPSDPFHNPLIAKQWIEKYDQLNLPACKSYPERFPIDPTLPTTAIFVVYNEATEIFIKELHQQIYGEMPTTLAIIISDINLPKFKNSPLMKKMLEESPELIKIITIPDQENRPDLPVWTQDFFHILPDGQQMAIYDIPYKEITHNNHGPSITHRITKELKTQSHGQIAHHLLSEVAQSNHKTGSLSLSGNMMAMPGGFYVTGVLSMPLEYEFNILGTERFSNQEENSLSSSYVTDEFHQSEIVNLEEDLDYDVLRVDVGFLNVGHVDEILSVVKTNDPNTQCAYAILYAAPKRGLQILDQEIRRLSQIDQGKIFEDPDRCQHSPISLLLEYNNSESSKRKVPESVDIENENLGCFFDTPIEKLMGESYLKKNQRNYFIKNNEEIDRIIRRDINFIKEKMKKSLKCQDIKTIPIPVLYTDKGHSLLPNSINSLIKTDLNRPSKIISPRTYYPPFEREIIKNITPYGLTYATIDDLVYFISDGDVHCATKSLPACL